MPKSEERKEAEPTEYFYNGTRIDVELLKPFMVKSYKPQSQGTDTAIIYRTYGFESIREMKILGELYIVGIGQSDEKTAVKETETAIA